LAVEFREIIGDLLAAALRSRKVKKLIGDRGITSDWSGQNCDILVLSWGRSLFLKKFPFKINSVKF